VDTHQAALWAIIIGVMLLIIATMAEACLALIGGTGGPTVADRAAEVTR